MWTLFWQFQYVCRWTDRQIKILPVGRPIDRNFKIAKIGFNPRFLKISFSQNYRRNLTNHSLVLAISSPKFHICLVIPNKLTITANKWPKGSQIVHLSTMYHLSWRISHWGRWSLFFDQPKNHKFVKDIEYLLLAKFHQFRFSYSRRIVEMPEPNWSGRPYWFSGRPEKHKLGGWCWAFASCQVSSNYVSAVVEKKLKNSLANQRPEQSSWFFDRPKKHKLSRGC